MTTAYDAIAQGYDLALVGDRWMRRALWGRYRAHFHAGQQLLDIGCGTGIDAVYLARQGMTVDGFDSSPEMLAVARRRATRNGVENRVQFWIDSIDSFSAEGPFDGVISGFAALNTVPDLPGFANHIASLLIPGGRAVLHLVNRFGIWEWLGGLRRGRLTDMPAVRTFQIGESALTHYMSTPLDTYRSAFAQSFTLLRASGYGSLRPPHTVRRIPSPIVRALAIAESPLRTLPPFRDIGRFFILELERR